MLSEKLKGLRKSVGYSQVQLAKRLNVTQSAISQWEKGLTRPDTDMLARIALEFGVTIDDLMVGEISETKKNLDVRPVTDEDLKFALWGTDGANISDGELAEVKKFARFVQERKK